MFKKILIICSLFIFSGCLVHEPNFHTTQQDTVYLDPYNSWVNNCPVNEFPSYGKCKSPWRSITLRAINKKYRDVDIKIVCSYDNMKFGERWVTINARNDRVFTVFGLARPVPSNDKVACRIVDIK